jgi:hypothetical protein
VRLVIAIVRLAIAIVRLVIAIVRLAIAIVRLAIAIVRLAIAIVRLAIAIVRLAIAIVRLAIAIVRLVIVIARLLIELPRLERSPVRVGLAPRHKAREPGSLRGARASGRKPPGAPRRRDAKRMMGLPAVLLRNVTHNSLARARWTLTSSFVVVVVFDGDGDMNGDDLP